MVGEIRGAHRGKQWTKLESSYDIASVVLIWASCVVLPVFGHDAGVVEVQQGVYRSPLHRLMFLSWNPGKFP